jgi:hypothetical protein
MDQKPLPEPLPDILGGQGVVSRHRRRYDPWPIQRCDASPCTVTMTLPPLELDGPMRALAPCHDRFAVYGEVRLVDGRLLGTFGAHTREEKVLVNADLRVVSGNFVGDPYTVWAWDPEQERKVPQRLDGILNIESELALNPGIITDRVFMTGNASGFREGLIKDIEDKVKKPKLHMWDSDTYHRDAVYIKSVAEGTLPHFAKPGDCDTVVCMRRKCEVDGAWKVLTLFVGVVVAEPPVPIVLEDQETLEPGEPAFYTVMIQANELKSFIPGLTVYQYSKTRRESD